MGTVAEEQMGKNEELQVNFAEAAAAAAARISYRGS